MSRNDTSMGGLDREFPNTSWSQIALARDPDHPASREHLESLISSYWKPAYHYIRAAGRRSVEDAKDLTQQFFARLLERDQLQHLDPRRGSFRGFLKRSLRNFMVDASRRLKARRPPEGVQLFRFDDHRDREIEARSADPEVLFDIAWNRTLLKASLDELESCLAEKPGYFDTFRLYFLGEDGELRKRTQQDVAGELGLSEAQVARRLSRCHQELNRILRRRISDYVRDEQELQAEYRKVLGA